MLVVVVHPDDVPGWLGVLRRLCPSLLSCSLYIVFLFFNSFMVILRDEVFFSILFDHVGVVIVCEV